MPQNPPAPVTRTDTIIKVASRNAIAVAFALGTITGGVLAIVAGAVL